MPFIKISSLHAHSFNYDEVVKAVETTLYEKEILPLGSATVLWQKIDAIAHTRESTGTQECLHEFNPQKVEFPIYIDLYATSVFNYYEISRIMESIATTVHKKTGILKDYVFIHYI